MKIIFRFLCLTCALQFAILVSAQAQTASPSADGKAAPTQAILAGRLIDVRTGHVSTNTYIIIEKDRIARIDTTAPKGVKIIDLSKYTVVPGLIDCHAHVLGNPKDQSSASPLAHVVGPGNDLGRSQPGDLARSRLHRPARCRRTRHRLWPAGAA